MEMWLKLQSIGAFVMQPQYVFNAASLLLTATIAIGTWLITRRQATTSEEKLRLDLYERRFDVYSRSIDFYQSLESWTGSQSNRETHRLFIKAKLESSFLFPVESGIQKRLQEMDGGAFKLIGYKDTLVGSSIDAHTKSRFHGEAMGGLSNFDKGIQELQAQMAPYLDFHDIRKRTRRPKSVSIR